MTEQVQVNRYVCFPSTVFVVDKPDHVQLVSDVSKEYLKRQEDDHQLDEIFPVYHTDNFSNDSRLTDFTSYVAQVAHDILDDQGYDMTNKRTYFSSMWLQDHHKNSLMEQHTHSFGSQLVGFFFLDTPTDAVSILCPD